jgi:hypothetical protein
LILSNSGTLTFSGWDAILTASNVVTMSGSAVNHAGPTTNEATTNRVYFICTNLTLNGNINVSYLGYSGGNTNHPNGYGSGGGGGSTIYEYGAGGGGHGAEGGNGANCSGGTIYGSLTNPANMGSGGGNSYTHTGSAAGGGAVHLEVSGTLTINSNIYANGYTPATVGYREGGLGGGAGGGIWITANTLAGTGAIQANGGIGGSDQYTHAGGGGAGGRIAIFYATYAHTGSIQARGGALSGSGGVRGGAGTIYLNDGSSTNLLLDNGDAALGSTGTWLENSVLNTLSTITITNGGVLKHAANTTNTTVTNSLNIAIPILTVATYGSINVSGRGWPGGDTIRQYGYGPGGGAGTTNYGYGSGGGGYGAEGGAGTLSGGSIYGSFTNPVDPGSGAGRGYNVSGGNGGGVIRLDIGILTVNGYIMADGTAGTTPSYNNGNGGGAGGSIWITAGTLDGTGTIRANGGAGVAGDLAAGGGGGGRVAIFYTNLTFNGAIQARGAAGGGTGGRGGAGTLYRQEWGASGNLLLDNGVASYGSAGTWAANEDLNTLSSLTITNGGVLKHTANSTNTTITNSLNISIPTLVVADYGSIDASARGWPGGISGHETGYGLGGGIGSAGFNTGGGGGGYGGAGGAGTLSGGGTYGSRTAPVHCGSGGGRGYIGGIPGAGGGLIKLNINSNLTLIGRIIANGGNATAPTYRGGNGGGSGGSIVIFAETLTGSGAIQANGGTGYCDDANAGGGGGGRIAVYVYRGPFYSPGRFTGTYSVSGGSGGGGGTAGSAGTIHFKPYPRGTILSSW